ncbi:DUF805 domain-containing protein [Testudinibacter sp. P27/CKL/0425]
MINWFICIISQIIAIFIILEIINNRELINSLPIISGVISMIIYLPILYSHLVRRAHDLDLKWNESSILVSIGVLQFINLIVIIKSPYSSPIVGVIMLALMIFLAFPKGTEGENQFGNAPIPFWKRNRVD